MCKTYLRTIGLSIAESLALEHFFHETMLIVGTLWLKLFYNFQDKTLELYKHYYNELGFAAHIFFYKYRTRHRKVIGL